MDIVTVLISMVMIIMFSLMANVMLFLSWQDLRKKIGTSDDDLLTAQIEVAAWLGSDLAKRLMLEIKFPKFLTGKEADELIVKPGEATGKMWNVFWEDFKFENTDQGRVDCLKMWLRKDTKFSYDEMLMITRMFKRSDTRAWSRAAMMAKL